jgi:hypothetical protein
VRNHTEEVRGFDLGDDGLDESFGGLGLLDFWFSGIVHFHSTYKFRLDPEAAATR